MTSERLICKIPVTQTKHTDLGLKIEGTTFRFVINLEEVVVVFLDLLGVQLVNIQNLHGLIERYRGAKRTG